MNVTNEQKGPRLTWWTTPDHQRHFLLPDDAPLPAGDLPLRTATGREALVDEVAARTHEVSPEEAEAWAREQLSAALGEVRTQASDFADRLRARADALREENRQTWEAGLADAPPEVRAAGDHLRQGLRRLGQALQRAARERGPDPDPPP